MHLNHASAVCYCNCSQVKIGRLISRSTQTSINNRKKADPFCSSIHFCFSALHFESEPKRLGRACFANISTVAAQGGKDLYIVFSFILFFLGSKRFLFHCTTHITRHLISYNIAIIQINKGNDRTGQDIRCSADVFIE